MNFLAKTLTIAGASLVLGGNAWAVIPEKYQTIVDRNAFGLVPPPPPTKTETVTAPPINIFVTGFATIGGERRVYFMIPPSPKEPGATQQYLSLSEGQRDGGLEVISILESEGEVRVKNGGSEMVMSLKEHGIQASKLPPGVKPPTPAPLGPAPGMVQGAPPAYNPVYTPGAASSVVANAPTTGQPQPLPGGQAFPGGMPQPATQPGQQPQNVQPSSERNIPTRTLRVPPVQQSAPSPQSSLGNSFGSSPVVFSPGANSPVVHGGNTGNQNVPETPHIDPAVQLAAMREYQRSVDRNGGNITVTVPAAQNPVIAGPATTTRTIPAPPLPPLPQ